MSDINSFTKVAEAKVDDKDLERMRANIAQVLKELQAAYLALQARVKALGG